MHNLNLFMMPLLNKLTLPVAFLILFGSCSRDEEPDSVAKTVLVYMVDDNDLLTLCKV